MDTTQFTYEIGQEVQYRNGEEYEFGTVTGRKVQNGYKIYAIDDREAVSESLLYPVSSGTLIQL